MKRILLLAAIFASFALNSNSIAQPGLGAIDPLTGLPIMKPDNGPRFNMLFDGGKPGELIEGIQQASKQRPNVIIHPDCAEAIIPPFHLRDVTANQIFNTLNSLNEPNYEGGFWRQVPLNDSEVWVLGKTTGVQFPQFGGVGNATPAPNPRSCRVFNLGPYLDTFKVEDITTAIQGAWELMKSDVNQSVKYHKDTKLLIVVGGKEELNVVNEVLMQLRSSLPKPAAAAVSNTPTPTATDPAKPTPNPKL